MALSSPKTGGREFLEELYTIEDSEDECTKNAVEQLKTDNASTNTAASAIHGVAGCTHGTMPQQATASEGSESPTEAVGIVASVYSRFSALQNPAVNTLNNTKTAEQLTSSSNEVKHHTLETDIEVNNTIMPPKRRRSSRETRTSLLPAERQIFTDLIFFFFPNNDANATRRMRIAKAVQYGATWSKDWRSDITHIIMDDGMPFEEFTKFMKISIVPDHIVVVNDKYRADCLSYCMLLSPDQKCYEVAGFQNKISKSTTRIK